MRQRTRNAWRRPVQPFLICVQPLVSLQGGFDPQPYCQVVSTCKHFAVITSQNTTCPHSRVVIEMLKLVLPCLRTMLSMALLLVQIRTCFKISSAVSTVSHETYGSPVIVMPSEMSTLLMSLQQLSCKLHLAISQEQIPIATSGSTPALALDTSRALT